MEQDKEESYLESDEYILLENYLNREELLKIYPNLFEEKDISIVEKDHYSIIKDTFLGLTELRSLRYSRNKRKHLIITKCIFEGLTNLLGLCLSDNGISNVLPIGIFSDLINLKYLNLSYNNFQVFRNFTFSSLTNLEYLDLSRNNLKTLPEIIFSTLKNLKDLNLSYNKLKSIPEGIFSSLGELICLNLDHNQFKTFEKNTFSTLVKLEYLYLQKNEIFLPDLPENLFSNLTKVKRISLLVRQVSSIPINFKDVLMYSCDFKMVICKDQKEDFSSED